jgi:hypothetical protein
MGPQAVRSRANSPRHHEVDGDRPASDQADLWPGDTVNMKFADGFAILFRIGPDGFPVFANGPF